jgi:hypothetical protein
MKVEIGKIAIGATWVRLYLDDRYGAHSGWLLTIKTNPHGVVLMKRTCHQNGGVAWRDADESFFSVAEREYIDQLVARYQRMWLFV